MNPCLVCHSSASAPRNILLTCAGCASSYHHRHHKPPVEDDELLVRINAVDPQNGLAAWRCVTCTPHGAPKSSEVIDIVSEDEQEPNSLSQPANKSPQVIVLDDSDEEVVPFDSPQAPVLRPSSTYLPPPWAIFSHNLSPDAWEKHRRPKTSFAVVRSRKSNIPPGSFAFDVTSWERAKRKQLGSTM